MTMRAPPLARMAAVAAPRPEAEPVTTAQRPSFDIAFSLSGFQLFCGDLAHGRRWRNSITRNKPVCQRAAAFRARRGLCRHQRLSWQHLFPIMAANKPPEERRVEAENIVVATAEKIFADLADAQTINSDKKGAWKTPLWQALSEAGLPLSWVAEDHGGSGVSLADGFALLGAAGRFAIAVPLAETMLAGWLLSQAKIASPEGEMTVAPAGPRDRVTVNADRTLSGRARG